MAAASVNRCSVFIQPDRGVGVPAEAPASLKIADIWGRTIKALSERPGECPAPLLGRLGVSETDKGAQAELIPLMQMASRGDVQIVPSKKDSGVYYLSIDGNPFGVFKVGTRRMQVEALARRIAHKVGLEHHIVPKVYCSIQNPALPRDDEMSEELWNGNVKIYLKPEGETTTLTGTLEPFLATDEEITPDDLASMTLIAFLLGLRDAKLDGKAGGRFFDVEDIMQLRLLPGPGTSPNRAVAATHLPYLADRLAKEPMSREKLLELSRHVNQITESAFHLLGELELERVVFADLPSERFMGFEEGKKIPPELKGKNRGTDDGGFRVKVIKQEKIMEDHPKIDISKTDRLLSPEQLAAFYDRLASMKRFIDTCVKMDGFCPSSLDLVKNADQMYGAHLKALETHNPARVQTAPDLIGVLAPRQTGSPLLEADRDAIRAYTPSPPVRSTSGSSSVSRFSQLPVRFGSADELRAILGAGAPAAAAPMEQEFNE